MKQTALLLFSCVAFVQTNAWAITTTTLAMEFIQYDIPLKNNTHLDIDALGIRYGEHYSQNLKTELLLGYHSSSIHQATPAIGFRPTGYYGGFNINYETTPHRALQLGGRITYTYYWTQEELDQQRVELRSNHSGARVWIALNTNEHIQLYACATLTTLEGERLLSGTQNAQLDFSERHKRGYCGGLRFNLSNDGYIILEGSGKHQRGGMVLFGRDFGE